jgi:antiviral defense system Shedu protein SduA
VGGVSFCDLRKAAAVPLDLEWSAPLKHRLGAATRLDRVDVYHDFEWRDHFPDERTQFKNGECLAQNLRSSCPEGKTPALLLTEDEDAEEGYRETPEHLVLVLNLPRYLDTYADPSLAYMAHRLGQGITQLGPLNEEAAQRAQAGAAVLGADFGFGQVVAWVGQDPARKQQLRELAGGQTHDQADIGEVLSALENLGDELDPESVAAIARLFESDSGRERRVELVEAITEDSSGLYLTGEVLAERTPQRIADAREALAAYERLLGDPDSGETALQAFIEEHVWILGLEYVKARPRHSIPRGAADFILERVDGFHDLLELKDPQDPIIDAPDAVDGAPPPASRYALSDSLANALAQVHVYRDTLTTDDQTVERLWGLPNARDPRAIVVIGRAAALPEHRLRVLREVNKSLHRVEIVPYDGLGERARRTLDNVEQYLLAAQTETEAADT